MSQVSGGEFCIGTPLVHRAFEGVEGATQWGGRGSGSSGEDVSEAWTEYAGVRAREEERGAQAGVGHPIAMRAGDQTIAISAQCGTTGAQPEFTPCGGPLPCAR